MDAAESGFFETPTEEHLAIAELAVQYGYGSFDEVGRLLLDLPELLQQPAVWNAKRIWVDAGPLDETEWLSIRALLDQRRAQRDPRMDRIQDVEQVTNPRVATDDHATRSPVQRQAPPPLDLEAKPERYVIGNELGRGGGGLVVRAFDAALQRVVAMKLPPAHSVSKSPKNLLVEATTTSRLEHPNVVPIYDTGLLPCGTRYYTMRRVTGLSLREVLRGLKNNEPKVTQRWSMIELLRAFIEITHAMEYAHHRSILHRDLKPENIMLGDFGEVYVMDWGLAFSQMDDRAPHPTDPNRLETVGTPAYMSPEQASGTRHLTPQTDIYSLGVILYEILTFIVPSRRDSVVETLLAVASEPILPPSKAVRRELDAELDLIVMRALQRRPEDRYHSVRALRTDLQVYVSGKRPHTANKRLQEALQLIEIYDLGVERVRKLRIKAQRLAALLRPSDSLQAKRSYWRAAERLEHVEKDNVITFERAMEKLNNALYLDPSLDVARDSLAALAWRRHQEALIDGDQNSEVYRTILRQHDRTGRYARLLDAPTSLRISADSEGIEAFIQNVETRDHRKVLGQLRHLGTLPLQVPALPRGSWHLTFKRPGVPAVHLPIFARSEDPMNILVSTLRAKELPHDFALVSQGESIIGGDKHALDPLPRQVRTLPSFAAQFRHVLVHEYLEWIRSLAHYDPAGALLRIPVLSSGLPLIYKNADNEYCVNPAAIFELNPDIGAQDDLPVVGVRSSDVEDYIRWRSSIDGLSYRLPTELEYERMARGADSRAFPWGNRFDPALCTMLLSAAERPRLQTVGHALSDIGPFGQRDLAGNVRELCTMQDGHEYVLRGGSWQTDERACRASSRTVQNAGRRQDDVGFRLIREV